MPISQARMITMIEHAATLVALHQTLEKHLESDIQEQLLFANSVIERTSDEYAKKALVGLLGTFNTIKDILRAYKLTDDERLNLMFEQKHFSLTAERNKAAAYRIKAKREIAKTQANTDTLQQETSRPSVSVGSKIFFGTYEELKGTPEFDAAIEELSRKERAFLSSATPPPSTPPQAGAERGVADASGAAPSARAIVPHEQADGTIVYRPADADLAASPIPPGQNVF